MLLHTALIIPLGLASLAQQVVIVEILENIAFTHLSAFHSAAQKAMGHCAWG